MSKRLIAAIGIAVIGISAWASGDPWKDKPYQEWTAKDVQRILNDSPWAHVIAVNVTWNNKPASGNAGEIDKAAPVAESTQVDVPGAATGRDYGADGAGGGGAGMQATTIKAPATPPVSFIVRWMSSRTVREAVLRDALLNGRITQAQADAEVARDVSMYQVIVASADMSQFEKASADALQAGASLIPSGSGHKIGASTVKVQRTPDGKIVLVMFGFPRAQADGTPAIAAGEKSVEFDCVFARFSLKTPFDLSTMADKKGSDL
jgi:hypothetical protein